MAKSKRTITTLRKLKEMLDEIPDEHLDVEVRVTPTPRPFHGHGSCDHQRMRDTMFLSIAEAQAIYENHDGNNTVDGVVDENTYVYLTFEWD
jgi:hypothetical protein